MKFSARRIREFLKLGMEVTVREPVDISREYESGYFANPSDIGTVKGIKCPVVRIAKDKRRPYDEFVSVEFDDERRGAVSYDNIQLLGFLSYLPEQYLDDFLLDAANAHSWRWSGIRETDMEVAFTNYDGSKIKRSYPIGSRY